MSDFDILDRISVMIFRWEKDLCPDCGAPRKTKNYTNKCSVKPDEHVFCDNEFYLRKIKEVLEK